MNEKHEATKKEIAGWCSTYGIVTAQRLLELYKIKLEPEDLIQTLKKADSFYHGLLKIPMRNVFNGIIWQQARDYQIYAQKLFIDYLLSGETNKDEEAPGASLREDLEVQRQELLGLNDNFHALEMDQERLIARCQASLIKDADTWASDIKKISLSLKKKLASLGIDKSEALIQRALITVLTRYDFKGELHDKAAWEKIERILGASLNHDAQQAFMNEIKGLSQIVTNSRQSLEQHNAEVAQMSQMMRNFRSDFYRFIVRSKELLKSLPDYKINDAKDMDHRETLLFDATIGEDGTSS